MFCVYLSSLASIFASAFQPDLQERHLLSLRVFFPSDLLFKYNLGQFIIIVYKNMGIIYFYILRNRFNFHRVCLQNNKSGVIFPVLPKHASILLLKLARRLSIIYVICE